MPAPHTGRRACPVDGTVLVENRVRVFTSDVTVDNCPRCEGVFLDRDEIMTLTDDSELAGYLRDRSPLEDNSMRLCPACHARMEAEETRGVELEVCANCGGIWLDKGELARLGKMRPA